MTTNPYTKHHLTNRVPPPSPAVAPGGYFGRVPARNACDHAPRNVLGAGHLCWC